MMDSLIIRPILALKLQHDIARSALEQAERGNEAAKSQLAVMDQDDADNCRCLQVRLCISLVQSVLMMCLNPTLDLSYCPWVALFFFCAFQIG